MESSEIFPRSTADRAALIDAIVQFVCLALLAYWAAILIKPFLTVIVWSIILAVVLYPIFDWMVRKLRMRGALAALLLTVLGLVILLGPATWLGLSLIGTLRTIAERLEAGNIVVPPPPDAVKNWPLIGDNVHAFWLLASTNLKAAMAQIGPQLKPFGSTLLGFAGSTAVSMLKFVAAMVISGFLLVPGPALAGSARAAFRRIAARRGDEFVDLIGATTRNLARGVIGLSILQALLAGIGFIAAGVPAPGFFSFLILLLGIVQIDAGIVAVPLVIWSWLTKDTTAALIFTVYMVPVMLLNNFLRPFVMAHGLKTPALVILIGLLGGLLAHGLIGLFVGPIVLAIAWELFVAWAMPPNSRKPAPP
jgi:predicted PurR-regulated permease PerM